MTRAIDGLMKWLRREDWNTPFLEVFEAHLGRACDNWDVDTEDLVSLIGAERFMTLWGCAFEDFLTRETPEGSNIVDDYLKRRGWKESASTKAYLKGLRDSVMSLYEVSDIVPGESFLARDLVRGGEPVRVSERSGTQYLKPWDRVAARIVAMPTKTVMGGGLLRFDHETSETLLGMLQRAESAAPANAAELARRLPDGFEDFAAMLGKDLSASDLLGRAAPVFTTMWLDDALRAVIDPELPELVNADGEDLVFCTLTYRLAPKVKTAAVRAVLDALGPLEPEDGGRWEWVEVRPPRGAEAPEADPETGERRRRVVWNRFDTDWVVMGELTLKHRRLSLEVNSRERAETGRRLLESALSGLVREPPDILERTPEELMAEAPPKEEREPLVSGLDPEEERALLREGLDRHYARMLEEPVPVLGGRTPMEAVRTEEGRQQAAEWLKSIENHMAHSSDSDAMAGYDIGWMWDRLGIGELRR